MERGRVKWFNDRKGFGFITAEDGTDLFVHYSDIVGEGFRTLREGHLVEFEPVDGPKGAHASGVRQLEDTRPPRVPAAGPSLSTAAR